MAESKPDSHPAEQLLEIVFDHNPSLTTVISPDFRIMKMNRKALSMVHLAREEAIGRHCYELYHERATPCEICAAQEVMKTGQPACREISRSLPDGSLRWFKTQSYPLCDSGGEAIGFVEITADITDRKRAEEALRTSAAQYKALFDDHFLVMLLIDPQTGEIVDANKAACGFYGYPVDKLKTMRIQEINTFSETQIALEMQNAQKRQKNYFLFEHRLADGSLRKVEVYSGAVERFGRELLYSIVRDVTGQMATELSLRKFSTAVEQSANTIIITDPSGAIEYVNPKFTELTGYTPVEAIGQTPRILNARTQPPSHYEKLWQTIAAGQVWRGEFHNRKKNGELYWEAATITPLWDEERKKIINYLGIKEDITARKTAEEALRASEEKFRLLAESLRDVVMRISLDGTILYASPSTEGFSGHSQAEVTGTNVAGYFAREEDMLRAFSLVREVVENKKTGTFEFLVKPKCGEPFPVENSYAPLIEEGRVIALQLILRDISERKRMEEELLKARKLESVGILAAGIAHDFNNILAGIFGNLQLAQLKLADDSPAQQYIVRAGGAMERATLLTKQLLTFAKGGDPILESVGIKEAIEQIVSFNLSGSNVKAHLDLPEGLWPLKADRGQFGQVIANLVINAVQAMPKGGWLSIAGENIGRLEDGAIPGFKAEGPFVKLTVRDEGCGIAAEHLGQVFDPYFTTKQGRTGLGLATIYSIVRRHHGHIGIASTLNMGTTFTLHLPAELSGESGETSGAEGAGEGGSVGGRVLIMDDEEMLRDVLGAMLEALGYTPDFAGDGKEAVAKYCAAKAGGRPYALVVMDLTIPGGMGGGEAVGKILESDPAAKVIVASGYSHDPILAHFEQHGFCGRLVKPFSLAALKAELQRVLK